MKKISVIVPVYNASKYLVDLIDSLKKQTIYKKLEIIFVDDGSTDDSSNIISKNIDSNIKLISKKNGGVSSARNLGIKNASCEYICFIDADDYIENDFFENLLNNNKYDLVVDGYVVEYTDKKIYKKNQNEKIINNNHDVIYNFIFGKINPNTWGKLYKKSIISSLMFDENLHYSEDRLFVFEYLLRCNNVYICNTAKYHYNINDQSAMRKKFNSKMFDSIKVMEKISQKINEKYNDLYEYSKSAEIDSKCRVIGEIYNFNVQEQYKVETKKIMKEIKKYGLLKKIKFSSKKHSFSYFCICIHPKIYNFIKNNLKFQYKSE